MFSLGQVWLVKVGKVNLSSLKTARLKFSKLKMQAVFTWKNKGFISKFPQSYTSSRDGIHVTYPGSSSSDRCLPNRDKHYPDTGAHLVVNFANSAFEVADKFTLNTFP